MSDNRCSTLGPLLVVGVLVVLGVLVAHPAVAWAARAGLPTRPPTVTPAFPIRPATATPVFPDRPPTVAPISTSPPSARPSSDSAAIELHVEFLPGSPSDDRWRNALWTAVEWQDGLGNWHRVDGWRAALDKVEGNEGQKVWYVSSEQFGKGPFCWLVHADPEGDPIAESIAFDMPDNAGETLQINLSIGQPAAATPVPETSASTLPVTGGDPYLGLRVVLTLSLTALLVESALSKRSGQPID